MAKVKNEKQEPLPIATVAAPVRGDLELLGVAACSGEWNLSGFPLVLEDLANRLRLAVRERFPNAVALYNFKWYPGAGHYGHRWADATADVYGKRGS